MDGYFKETMRAGPSKTEKAPKVPRAPKQITMYVLAALGCDISSYLPPVHSQDFQFFPPKLAVLQERELNAHKVSSQSPVPF